ncbi:MAG: HIT family protein [Acidimicrobiia bacterium]
MTIENLWAGWRGAYIETIASAPGRADTEPTAAGTDETANAVTVPADGTASLFERILTLSDEEGYVVHRGRTGAVLLNAYPYTNGHVLVLPNRAVRSLGDLTNDEHTELWELVRAAVGAIEAGYGCDGINIGMNLGKAAGAGVPEHLHVHALPRWNGDTNFTTTVANVRVMPETLRATWQKLRAAWPA